jgi:polyphosphate kinase
MRRNLYNRVEVVFPVINPNVQRSVLRILATGLMDTYNAWELRSDGLYDRVNVEGETPFNSQDRFMENSFGIEALPLDWET